jgi:hypothetical protein
MVLAAAGREYALQMQSAQLRTMFVVLRTKDAAATAEAVQLELARVQQELAALPIGIAPRTTPLSGN